MASNRARGKARRRREPYKWLGASAITLGLGVAMAGGAGLASADTSDAGAASSTSSSGQDGGASGAGGASGSSSATGEAGSDKESAGSGSTGDTGSDDEPSDESSGSTGATGDSGYDDDALEVGQPKKRKKDDADGQAAETARSSAEADTSDEAPGAFRASTVSAEETAGVTSRSVSPAAKIANATASVRVAETGSAPVISPSAAPEVVGASVSVITSFVNSFTAQLYGTGSGGAGLLNPLSWVAAAAARRELGAVKDAPIAASMVSTASIEQVMAAAAAGGSVAPVGNPITIAGGPGQAVFSHDGSRALFVSSSNGDGMTRIVLINTATGAQIGATVKLAGAQPVAPGANLTLFNADGTRAMVTTVVYDSASNTYTTRTVLINTATGAPVGTTLKTTGSPTVAYFSADGARALVNTVDQSSGANVNSTVLINTATGALVAPAVKLAGFGFAQFSANSTRVVISSYNLEATGSYLTRVVLLNAATGAQVGATVKQAGIGYGAPNSDSTRVSVTTYVPSPGFTSYTSQNTLFNATTFAKVGATVTLAGYGTAVFNPDGSRLMFTTTADDAATGGPLTRVVMINTATGAQIGSTQKLVGTMASLSMSVDGTRALVVTRDYDTSGNPVSKLALINTATGAQIGGAPVVLAGTGSAFFSADSSRVLFASEAYDGNSDSYTTRVVTLNAVNRAQLGTTLKLVGRQLEDARFAPNSTRTLVTTSGESGGFTNTQVTLINSATGAQVGSPVLLTGEGGAQFTADSTRLVFTSAGGDSIARTAVINAATGALVAPTFKLAGNVVPQQLIQYVSASPVRVSPDGLAFVLTSIETSPNTYTTRFAVLDTATGAQIGTTYVTGGDGQWAALNPQGNHVLIGTSAVGTITSTTERLLRITV